MNAGETPKNTAGRPAERTVEQTEAGPLTLWVSEALGGSEDGPVQGLLQGLIRGLSGGRGADLQGVLPDPETVAAGAQATELMLLCASPVQSLCLQMAPGADEAGIGPEAALERWMAEAEAVLAVNRRNRRRVHVLDVATVLSDPESVFTRFRAVIELNTDLEAKPLPDPDPVLALLAQHCLNRNPKARALAGELEAVMAGSGTTISDDPEAAFQAWRSAGWAGEEAGLLRTQMSLMLEESELMRAQARAGEIELQELSENALMMEQRLAQMNEGMASYQAQLDEAMGEAERLTGKLSDKEQALTAAGAQMRNAAAQVDELARGLRVAEAARDAQAARVHALETSRSYRMMAPLRALRARLSGRG